MHKTLSKSKQSKLFPFPSSSFYEDIQDLSAHLPVQPILGSLI